MTPFDPPVDCHGLAALARHSIGRELQHENACPPPPPSLRAWRAATFVTLRSPDGELRGCVGSIEPRQPNVWQETDVNARRAAFHDPRFPPISDGELDDLRIEVSVLSPLNDVVADDCDSRLDPAEYGIVVTADKDRRGVLLPGIEGVETWQEQVAICRKKGRISTQEPVAIARFQVWKEIQ